MRIDGRSLNTAAEVSVLARGARILHTTVGLGIGVSLAFNWFAWRSGELPQPIWFWGVVVLSGLVCALGLGGIHWLAVRNMRRAEISVPVLERLLALDLLSLAPFAVLALGVSGFHFTPAHLGALVAIWLVARIFIFAFVVLPRPEIASEILTAKALSGLCFVSGFAALIYQIVWQRALFGVFGVNLESVTMIVGIFMLGLGLGSLLGGSLTQHFGNQGLQVFLICECLIGVFGILSLPLIDAVGRISSGWSRLETGLAVFALFFLPTCLMGCTLPVLVNHIGRAFPGVAQSFGTLYFANTAGSAFACFFCVHVMFPLLGRQASLLVAATANFVVGTSVALLLAGARR